MHAVGLGAISSAIGDTVAAEAGVICDPDVAGIKAYFLSKIS